MLYLGATIVVRDVPDEVRAKVDHMRRTCRLRWLWTQHADAWWVEPPQRFAGDVLV